MTVHIAISMGDPAGIGPEIVLRALTAALPPAELTVFGNLAVFDRTAEALGLQRPVSGVRWVDVGGEAGQGVSPGATGAAAGALQVQSLEAAVGALQRGEAHGLCTAPITKAAARAAGFPFPGHTEYLAHALGAARHAMMLAGPTLRVVPVTGHLPLREVAAALSEELVAARLVVTAEALVADLGVPRPRVALAAVNPHAGEEGMLGDEEERILVPGMERARRELAGAELPAELIGPLPADALFARRAGHDAVVCCYHDQAMIPLKMAHPDDSVNVTLGLPAVRTSPAHGSALDIAGQGVANPASMIAALRLAHEICLRRARAAAG